MKRTLLRLTAALLFAGSATAGGAVVASSASADTPACC